MALPRLNEVPKYELIIPSTKETVKFRPFLVKEQKVLLLAYESQDKKQILRAVTDTIEACVDGIGDNLTTYDVDYIFTQIRAKSVGETTMIQVACEDCDEMTDVRVDLGNIEVFSENEKPMSNIIALNDKMNLKLKHPTYNHLINIEGLEEKKQTELLMDIVVSCLDSILTEEEHISFADESREEIMDFIDSLNPDQFSKISDYITSMPALKTDIKFKCNGCGKEQTRELKGLDDFF